MANDGLNRNDPLSPPPGQAAAVERIIGRHFEDDQIDASTITPSAADSAELASRQRPDDTP